MASPLKDLYSPSFYDNLSKHVKLVLPSFDEESFIALIHSSAFAAMELKERMRHTSTVLHSFLPADQKQAIGVILKIIDKLKDNGIGEDTLEYMFLPDYVEVFGLDDYETSVTALERITQFVSCEYAVRPFLLKYGARMMQQMQTWSLHENHKVRRLASEGSRPRLPWGKAVPELKQDPSPILPILENLKDDPSEWVRRSVANNLNDIAKDHPDLVIAIVRRWSGMSKYTDAVIRHGSRTLLKQGHPDILSHYGLQAANIHVSAFEILTPRVKIGESVEFRLVVNNRYNMPQIIRLEYGIYYRKANGQLSKKVFKISEKLYEAMASVKVHRRQSFKLITTRRFYTGEHQLSIIVNGEEKGKLPFVITQP